MWSETAMPLEQFVCQAKLSDKLSTIYSTFDCLHPYSITTKLLYQAMKPVSTILFVISCLEIGEYFAAVSYSITASKSGSYRIKDAIFTAYTVLCFPDYLAVMVVIKENIVFTQT
jgi:hypothetical protein